MADDETAGDAAPAAPDAGAAVVEPSAAPAPTAGEAASAWVPAPRARRRWPWIVAVATVVVAAAVAGGIWFAQDARARADAARGLSPAQQALITAALDAQADTGAQIVAQRDAYRQAVGGWEADQAAAEAWLQTNDAPAASVANPGGTTIPGGDPDGQAFLDAIGATDVQVFFDAGTDNCGYTAVGDDPFSYSAGGCYDSRFRNWLFLAWERGGEELVWPVFVHEAMHWYQYQHYYPLFLSAGRAGVAHDAYRGAVESDASCRAVVVYGIDPAEYEGSSSPCDVDGWYEGWLRDAIAAHGVRVSEPVAAEFEVREAVRP